MKKFILRDKYDWAIIAISEDNGLLVMIHSSYGSWAFDWISIGGTAIEFLETADCSYTFGKFGNASRLGASQKVVKREFRSYEFFYNTFWKMMIEQLKLTQ